MGASACGKAVGALQPSKSGARLSRVARPGPVPMTTGAVRLRFAGAPAKRKPGSTSMSSEAHPPAGSNGAPKGLPPVAPPSGRFIVQLFLIPGLIISVVVFIVLGSQYLVRTGQDPEKLLEGLD